ncbi:hypothetical protein A3Q56_00539 [Intoshia linei]|uniref:Neurotransmitter-gated ion-channel ligand-binding domain-containing protein n=1 Tax=Intoshia linei TaxID=1819745 RepID=A0A177BDC4_9BILA|nr:hypothetical protein A3Q56_00539 [Intoshia linei]
MVNNSFNTYSLIKDEKNQIMKSNVWLKMNPEDFGGIKTIRLSPHLVWKLEIVLFNNADGIYEVSYKPNVVIYHNGDVLWIPPAIYKSSCIIEVEYFPFDEQECEMNFGRKTLFYTINLIIPCILISFLSVAVFYLPAEAGEKVTMFKRIVNKDHPTNGIPKKIVKAANSVKYIANHLKNEDSHFENLNEWRYTAMVIDRLQFYIFLIVTIDGTISIVINAPHIFEFVNQDKIKKELMEN